MGRADYYKEGDWNAVCYSCGFKFKASMLRRYWQGYYVCESCWEPRQPQDFTRATLDRQSPPWAQPQPNFVFGLDFLVTETSAPDIYTPDTYIQTETGSELLVTES